MIQSGASESSRTEFKKFSSIAYFVTRLVMVNLNANVLQDCFTLRFGNYTNTLHKPIMHDVRTELKSTVEL